MPDISATALTENIKQLRFLILVITQFISGNILDPHAGFENQFLGACRNSESSDDLLLLLRMLIESLRIIQFSSKQLQELDRELMTNGLPPLSFLRNL
jgi:hypothetical protein